MDMNTDMYIPSGSVKYSWSGCWVVLEDSAAHFGDETYISACLQLDLFEDESDVARRFLYGLLYLPCGISDVNILLLRVLC